MMLGNIPEMTALMSGRAGIRTPTVWLQSRLLTMTCIYSLFLNFVARNRSLSPTASAKRNLLAQ